MDAVDPDLVDQATAAIGGVQGIQAVRDLRIRWIGHTLRAEADITVDPTPPEAPTRGCWNALRSLAAVSTWTGSVIVVPRAQTRGVVGGSGLKHPLETSDSDALRRFSGPYRRLGLSRWTSLSATTFVGAQTRAGQLTRSCSMLAAMASVSSRRHHSGSVRESP